MSQHELTSKTRGPYHETRITQHKINFKKKTIKPVFKKKIMLNDKIRNEIEQNKKDIDLH
jgi:hypothetical protein